ncbi:MAG: oligopeptide/dipeptide ABC transporter ATP-binding protein, partial [Paralcaligenes sp.]
EGLMKSIPALGARLPRLTQIDGSMPRLGSIPPGCAFNPRCKQAGARCVRERPELAQSGSSEVACWLYSKGVNP